MMVFFVLFLNNISFFFPRVLIGFPMRQFCVSTTIGFGHRKSPTSVAIRGEVFHSGLVSESRRMFGLS